MSPTIINTSTTTLSIDIKPIYVLYAFIVYVTYRIIHQLILWPYFFSPLRNVPGPPLGNPLWGQAPAMVRQVAGIPQREWVSKHGPVVRVVGPVGIERLIFTKPAALHQILVKDWLDYPRPSYLKNILGLVTGYGLLTVTGDEHRKMRKVMNPAFSIPNLMAQTEMYFEPVEGLVDIFKAHIDLEEKPQNGKEIHIYDWMSKVTLDIICETAFGYNADSLHNPQNELAEAYELLLSLQTGVNFAGFMFFVSLPGGPRFLASDWAYHHRNWFARIPLLKTKKDIMSILVRARKAELDGGKGGYAMSDRAMTDQVLTFLGAGHETTASGLTWTLWHLSNNLEPQRRLRAELAPIFADNPRPDYRTLKDLQWLDCVVMESLRIMPPVPVTVRQAAKTDFIDGVLVPKGTLIDISIRVINTWKAIWGEDADEFNPARWLDLPAEYHPTFSMLSFIAGPHGCIGRTMSIIEMKAVLAALIVNFEFEPAFAGQAPKPASAITVKPTDGMPLRVRRVSSS